MYCRPQLDAGLAQLSPYGGHGDTDVGTDLSEAPAIAVEADGATNIPADGNRHDLQFRMIGPGGAVLGPIAARCLIGSVRLA
jgi:hypothetical protein